MKTKRNFTNKQLVDKIASWETNPLGGPKRLEIMRAEREFNRLPYDLKISIGRKIERKIEQYHRPIDSLGGASAYDMDQAMLYGG